MSAVYPFHRTASGRNFRVVEETERSVYWCQMHAGAQAGPLTCFSIDLVDDIVDYQHQLSDRLNKLQDHALLPHVVLASDGEAFNLGGDLDVGEESDQTRLQARLQAARWDGTGKPVYNLPVALSLMVFFALCAQCAATLAVIKRETASWRWPVFAFTYMTLLAYVGALVTYQVTSRIWL